MVIDTSVIIAIFANEPDAESFERQIANDPIRLISAASILEAGIVIESRLGSAGGREFDLWLRRAAIETVPVAAGQADMARRAWRRFGKGRHPAGLNFGDCFSYALAITQGEPLLFIGSDFTKTDVKRCAVEG